jgi:DNA-binding SARP family transcriptional activator/tetratricopeptide (TPR) repeat protein
MRNDSTRTFPVHIFLLGRFEVTRGKQHLQARHWTRRKAASLLQRLALERRLLKDQAIEFLWPNSEPTAGANNLYRTLYALRKTLTEGLELDAPETVFTFNDGRLQLNEDVWVDVHEFKRLLASQPALPEALQQAIDLYQGELLPDDRYSEWTQTLRPSLHRTYREACLALAEHHRRHGRYPEAIALLTPLLSDDLADEPVHRSLMRLYTLAGRRHDALRQYQVCAAALADELSVSPSPETENVHNQIMSGELPSEPEPEAHFPKLTAETESRQLPPAPIAIESAAASRFVGRRAELEQMQAAFAASRQRQGDTILLAGDTGVGKTRLAYEALRLAAGEGIATLFGAAYEQEGQLPYQPFIEAFNRYLAGQERPLTGNPITHFQPADSKDLQQEQWALFNSVATFLAQLSQSAGAVLLIDDLHAADEASLRLFHYLARHTRHTPIVLLATYRTDLELPVGNAFDSLLNALYRERLRSLIPVNPLSADAVSAIVTEIWHGEVEEALLQAIVKITEGNPFFTEEVTHALAHSDRVEQVAGRWRLKPGASLHIPSGLGELLRQEVSRLGTAVTTTLEIAAVIGRQFRFGLLHQVSPLAEWELLDILDTALTARLIAESDEGYRFHHGLIRHVLYEGQSRARRTRLHTHVGNALETIWQRQDQATGRLLEALVYHFERSQKRERALPYLLQAGHNAADVFAFDVAVNDFERALDLMDELELDDPAQRWEILESLGWWHKILANTPRAVAYFEQALDLPSTLEWEPARHDRVRAHCGAAMALLTAGDPGPAEAHLQAALEHVDADEDAAEYADVLYNMAQVRWHQNEYQSAFDLAQRSLTVAERLDKPEAVARAFEMLALACHSLGEWQQGLAFEERRTAVTGAALDVSDAFDVHL